LSENDSKQPPGREEKAEAETVAWRPWGQEAFDLARDESKPVFLSISAVWCHWCHVMDETVFSDPEIASFINHNFVPVRVDSDRRPEINSRYNQGGWPTICFLTEEGEIIAGTTFLPVDQLRRMLIDVLTVYSRDADRIEAAIESVRERREAEASRPGGKTDASCIEAVLEVVEQAYDGTNGGFGTEPKFPYASVLKLLLAGLAGGAEGNEGEIVRTTLEAMSKGGIYDQVEGGFFRYATAQDWSNPHYEKMLVDNAALMAVYAEAYRLSAQQGYEDTVRGIYSYLTGVLQDPETGAFAGSQDADESYYNLDAAARQQAGAPRVDRTIFSGWNAKAAASLLRAYQVLGDQDFRDQALRALDFIWDNLWDADAGPAHYREAGDGDGGPSGLLADTAPMIGAALDAYESGAGDRWLKRATGLARWMLGHLEDQENGGFFDTAVPPGKQGYPSERNIPPVENSAAATALIRLAQNTGQKEFDQAARRTLDRLTGSFEQYGLFGASFALAVMRLFDPPVRVTIVGPPADQETAAMIKSAHSARIPFRSIEVLDPELHGEDLDAAGYGYEGKPIAYICVGASCQPPVDNPAHLPLRLESSWSAVSGH
jgi:uncharacterized protein YyaL (SSP411 family)